MSETSGRALTLPQLAEAAAVEYRTLHTWLKRGLIAPTVYSSTGSGRPNLFSLEDALSARILADLRRAGLDLEVLERTAAELQSGTKLGPDDVLVINGRVEVLAGDRQITEALGRKEPALLYRVSWALEALAVHAT
jgi:DNA-binding transcriptional MerR regulator